jgi:hypothetical protein
MNLDFTSNGIKDFSLDSSRQGSLPSEQEKMAAAERAAVRKNEPAQRFFKVVPGSDASETDGPAMRAVCREHSWLPLRLGSSPSDGALAVGGGPARRFPLELRRVARLGAGVGMETHFVFSKSHGAGLAVFAPPLQQSTAQKGKLLDLDAVSSGQSKVRPDGVCSPRSIGSG